MRTPVMLTLVALTLLAAPVAAPAAEEPADGTCYSDQAVGKLKHGVSNVLLGWTAIVREPVRAGRSGGNVFTAFGKGIWQAVTQTAGGVVQVATFPLPQLDVPVSEESAYAKSTPAP